MEWNVGHTIYNQLKTASNDPIYIELWDDFIRSAVKYAQIRTEWKLSDPQKRAEMDSLRTSLHDNFIDTCNILADTCKNKNLILPGNKNLAKTEKI